MALDNFCDKLAVVVPHGVLFRGAAEGRIRTKMIEENLLAAVIGLPGTLNVDLIRAPRESIDYVTFHELSHLRYDNHGPAFYRFLDRVMPDWKRRKHKLEVTLA